MPDADDIREQIERQRLRMKELVEKHWNIDAIISDLRGQEWHITDPKGIERLTYLGSYENFCVLASEAVPENEWEEAVSEGFENEIVEDYMEVLARVLSERMDEDVYVSYHPDLPGDIIAGQYEEGDIEELRRKGFHIVD